MKEEDRKGEREIQKTSGKIFIPYERPFSGPDIGHQYRDIVETINE